MASSSPTLSKSTAAGLLVTSMGAIVVGWWNGRWWWLLAGAGVVGTVYSIGQLVEGVFTDLSNAIGGALGNAWDDLTGANSPNKDKPYDDAGANEGTDLDGTMAPSGPAGNNNSTSGGQQ